MRIGLPKDPVMMLGVVNTKLRDYYKDIDALCEDMQVEKEYLLNTLRGINYEYDESKHQFI